MKKLPEGVRRVCLVLGVLLIAGWVIFAAVSSHGYANLSVQGWLFFVVGSAVLFCLPGLLYRLFVWMRDGFKVEKDMK